MNNTRKLRSKARKSNIKNGSNSDIATIRSAFRYITGDTDHICRICFASTENEEVSIDDNAKLQKPYFDDTVSYLDMLEDLGIKLEPSLPQVLCINCATTLTNSYLFKKHCLYSDKKWNELMERFNKSLDLADTTGSNVLMAYLVVNETENVMFTCRKNSETSKKAALIKLKKIIKSRENYLKIKKREKSVRCEVCKQIFSSNCHLVKHYEKAHNKTNYPCRYCTKVFTSPMDLEHHAERVHYSKKIQCPKCSKMFSTERLLRYHDKLYHVAAICKLCFVQFPSKKDMRAHMDKHDVNSCPKCSKSFLNKQSFKIHQTTCGNTDKTAKFLCDICNKGYVQKNGLKTHLKTSHGFGRVFSCSWCGKKFDAISRLKSHIVKHTKEKNFHCEQCGGRFVTRAALVYHSRLHTGERPFPCDLCNESFLSASRRMQHKRWKHFGPTKECPICHMKFVTGNLLRKHVDKHYTPHSKLYAPEHTKIKQAGDEVKTSALSDLRVNSELVLY